MQLEPTAFNAHLGNMGQNVLWRESQACPCRVQYSGGADPDCPHCNGAGRLWSSPVASVTGIVSREIVRKYAAMAQLDLGDVMLVIPSDQPIYDLGENDRVTMTDRTEPFSLHLVRGVSDVLPLRFNPTTISSVTWIAEGNIVLGAPPGNFFDGQLAWSSGAPPNNQAYVLTGRRNPEYFCYLSLPLDRPHHQGAPLPRRVILRRFDLFGA